jgi:hypothetical protein
MAKCWMSVAMIAFAAAGTALGQDPYLPLGQNKPALMPEPVPCLESQMGNMPPRPTAAADTPNSLPGNTNNAWNDEYCSPPACYLQIGYFSLVRSRLDRRPVAIPDDASGGVDTGNFPMDPTIKPIADFHDIDPRFMNGVRATLGVHWDTYAVELSGFHLAQSQASRTYASHGRLDTFFNINGDLHNFPIGFEGNNGMWLQDDIIRTHLQTALSNGEVNFRWWPLTFGEINMLAGVRYLDMYERVGIFAGDDDLTVLDVNGHPNPILQADYTTTAHNRILAGQLGWEWNKPLTCWLASTISLKGAWGVNFLDVDTLLKRGDGLIGQPGTGHHSESDFSHLYEAGFFLNFLLRDNIHVRAGYDLLWVVDITQASDAVDFNLANSGGRSDPHGSAFYHGPVVEFHILF